jgi:hypothetical protein
VTMISNLEAVELSAPVAKGRSPAVMSSLCIQRSKPRDKFAITGAKSR